MGRVLCFPGPFERLIMIFKTKRPHRVYLKNGVLKTYQPGYPVSEKDEELLNHLKYHRMYRKDIYMNKIAASAESTEPEEVEEIEIEEPKKRSWFSKKEEESEGE